MKAANSRSIPNPLGVITIFDSAFAMVYATAIAQILGLVLLPTLLLALVSVALRISLRLVVGNYYMTPAEDLLRRAYSGRNVSADSILHADKRLRAAVGAITLSNGIMSVLLVPIVVLGHSWFVGRPGVPTNVLAISLEMSLASALGIMGISLPNLNSWVGNLAGQVHVLAVEHGLDLERMPRSIAPRVTTLGLILVVVPACLLLATSQAAQARREFQGAAVEAAAIGGELARSDNPSIALAHLEPSLDRARTTAFVLPTGGTPVSAGRLLPAWATPELLAKDARPAPPDPTVALETVRRPDGVIVGALVELQSTRWGDLMPVLMTLIAIGLWGPACAWLLTRSVSLPIRRAAELAEKAARGGRLSELGTLPVAQLDEIGTATANLNELLGVMRAITAAVGTVADGNLAVEIRGQGDLPEAVRGMVQQLRKVVKEMHTTSAELASAATEIFAASQEQESASTSHSAGMVEISQTMESLAESAAHVSGAVVGVLENAERTLNNTDQMVSRINQLTAQANRIGDTLDVIREIADRTDLLALNGSLEATRAGEAGLGFSIVATEMRRLAERVTASVGDIKSLITEIRESGASTVVATEESKKLAENTTVAARKITLVSQQQQSSTQQVTQNVRLMSDVVRQAAAATTQTRSSAETLKIHADRLAELVRGFQIGG